MQRRLNQLKGNLGLFIIFLLIGICCQLRFSITDRIQLDLSSIALMIVIYLGYKLGRTAGLIAGIIVSWFWILVFIFKGIEFACPDLVFSGVYHRFGAIQLLGFSLQHGLFILFLGWTAGYLCDEFDKILAKQGMNINSLLPMQSHSIMIRVSNFISNLLKKDKDADESSDVSGRNKFKWPRKVNIIPIILFLVIINFSIRLIGKNWSFYLFPMYLPSVAILLFAYHKGRSFGIRLSFAVSFITSLVFLQLTLSDGGFDILPPYGLTYFSIFTPAQLVGISIASWWAGAFGQIVRDEKRRAVLFNTWKPFIRERKSDSDPGYGFLFIYLLFFIYLSYSSSAFGLSYHALIFFVLISAIWSMEHDASTVSNRFLWIMVILIFFDAFWPITKGLSFRSSHIDFIDLIIIGLIPLIIGRLDLKSLPQWRFFSFGILITFVFSAIFLKCQVPFFPLIKISIKRYPLFAVNWLLTLIGFEVAARILHYKSLKLSVRK